MSRLKLKGSFICGQGDDKVTRRVFLQMYPRILTKLQKMTQPGTQCLRYEFQF